MLIYTYVCVHVSVYIYVCIYIYMYASVYIYIYMCQCVCMFIYISVCMYVCVYIYIVTRKYNTLIYSLGYEERMCDCKVLAADSSMQNGGKRGCLSPILSLSTGRHGHGRTSLSISHVNVSGGEADLRS